MEDIPRVIDYKMEGGIPKKLARFEEFTELMKKLALQGTEKYSGAEAHEKETIDIIPDILGEEGYTFFVLGDLLKRIIRFKNQRRERDLVKMALWAYLLWMRLFPKQESKVPMQIDKQEQERFALYYSNKEIYPDCGMRTFMQGRGPICLNCGWPSCE